MKYYALKPGVLCFFGLPPKLLMIMKLVVVIIFTCLMQVSASTLAQKITLSEKNAQLEQVLNKISSQANFKVVYADDALARAHKINLQFNDLPIDAALEQVFKNQPLTYEIKDRTIIVKPKAPTFLESLAERWAAIDVAGRVVDSENRPLPGASVKVKKTGKAVSADGNGYFVLRKVEEGTVLVVSFIGYVSREVRAAKEMGNIALEVSLSKLDEVQVIAYGTTTQRLSTGNVTTIKADVIEKQPVNNPLLALQGRVPGLFIEQATGFAGTGVKVRIQGQNSSIYGSDPLYVIDGVPFISQLLPGGNSIVGSSGGSGDNIYSVGNPMSFINPSDIESIDVLKDADATAIYGSRAANGAILITTKKGKAGDTQIDLNVQSGWAKVPRKLDLMNSQQYLEMREEALKNDGIGTPALGPYGDNDLNGNWDRTRNADWQKELIGGSASYQDINASVSGGNDRTNFLIGSGYHRETNVFPGKFSDNKTSVRFNINNASKNQKFRIQFYGSYLFDNNQLPVIDLTKKAMELAPVTPVLLNSNGSINWAPDASGTSTSLVNPIGYLFDNFSNKTNNLISNMTLSYQIISGLEFKSTLGYNKLFAKITQKSLLQSILPEFIQYKTRSTVFINNDVNSWSIEPQLSYTNTINKGKLEILLGATISKDQSIGSGIIASGFSNDLVMEDIASATKLRTWSSVNYESKYNAAFARINYNWLDKYVLNLAGRRDGSSRFGPKSQFHNFASISGAWIFSNEGLIKDNLKLLSFGKLKISYGTMGNNQIPDYLFLSLYDPVQQGVPYQGIAAYQPNRLTNPYLEWEETKKLQFGLDLGFLDNKVLLNFNFYRNRSSNQLEGYLLPLTTGFSDIQINSDRRIQNSGWEFTASSTNIGRKDFKWETNINLTIPKTLVISSNDKRFPAKGNVGQPLSSIYVYHFLGVNSATGVYQFQDRNGNPTSTPDDVLDRTVLLDFAPKFYGGIQNSFFYKRFQLDFLLSFVKQIAQNQRFAISDIAAGNNNGATGNQQTSILERWRKPGDVSTIQRFTSEFSLDRPLWIAKNSDASWSDATYIRLKNVSLSWQFPERWNSWAHLHTCTFFLQAQNLLTITDYKGLDPETKSSTILPPLRVITLGVKVAL